MYFGVKWIIGIYMTEDLYQRIYSLIQQSRLKTVYVRTQLRVARSRILHWRYRFQVGHILFTYTVAFKRGMYNR